MARKLNCRCSSRDIRMKKPNAGDYLSDGAMHSFEHLFATYARKSSLGESVVYVGPMGCRTGFYFLVRDKISHEQALRLIQDCFRFIASFDGEIPGSKRWECGNYLDHDLPAARQVAEDMSRILENWTAAKMQYRS